MVEPLGNGAFRVTGTSRATRAWAAVGPDATWVYLEGRVYVVPDQAEGTAALQRRDPDALAAPMPATVMAVHVAPGTRVEPGDLLVTLEAMKMELQVSAPRAGTVTRVDCRAGELVQPGHPLVELA